MIYKNSQNPEILANGTFRGYNFWILSYGTHPCAYVEIPKNHPFYGKTYMNMENLDLDVHGGITFSNSSLHDIIKDTWIIGWDYAHAFDYSSIFADYIGEPLRKWTTEEIYEEIEIAIIDLINMTEDETVHFKGEVR